jgi:glycine cleavage system aminomethyltransferase T
MAALRQSALFHTHERAGAGLVDHHGWRVAAYYTWAQKEAEQLTKTAALADVSWMVKLDLKGYGLKTPPALNDARAWLLGQQHYLVTCDPAASDGVLKQLRSISAAPPDLSLLPAIYVTDVTSVYSQLLLAGPRGRDVLRKLTSLNVGDGALPNLSCAQANVAHVQSTVLREDLNNIPAFHVLFSRESAESVWEAILHAGHEFQIVPFGLRALELMGGRL